MDDRDPRETERDEDDAELKSPEDAADRFGLRAALLVLCVGFAIAVLWLMNSPSFQRCSGLETLKDRVACYEGMRTAFLKPPVK